MSIRTHVRSRARGSAALVLLAAIGAAGAGPQPPAAPPPGLTLAADPGGVIATFNAGGEIRADNAFFRSLGSNGRSCATCHVVSEALSFTPGHARRLYLRTDGTDPLFASVDGANCPGAAPGDRRAHSLILDHGLIRIGVAIPVGAAYSISLVRDPTGCALRVDPDSQLLTASVYRRPLPAANLSFLSAVMFDGRETLAPLASPQTFAANLRADLARQASDATTGHAQARSPPADAVVQSIVDFELGLFTAQYADRTAGPLDARGADGGPIDLAAQRYYPGINDPLGADPAGAPFAPDAMSLFRAWESSAGEPGDGDDGERARADIAAGERLFNSEVLRIRDVRGLNDNASLGRPALILGHCSTCHDAPNVGNHSLPLPLDIGTAHSADPSLEPDPRIRAAVAQLDPPQLPVFLISGCPDAFGSGRSASFYTTDPGRALITGRCSDLNLIKGPVLRGLAARAPYFHNGAASTLMQVVNFYDQRFEIGLTLQQKRQLAAFLDSL